MVEFGKTLNEVVKRDWCCHTVSYVDLKRCLGRPNNNRDAAAGADDHSVHTESSFRVADEQKDEFFRIYNGCVQRLVCFYAERLKWSEAEKDSLGVAVEKQVNMMESEDQVSSLSFLIHRVADYSKDLSLAIEFLDLNATAFSKIMKKYDKRTGSILREKKLKELKKEHPFLYGGGELKTHKSVADDWKEQLKSLLDKTAASQPHTKPTHGRRKSRNNLQLSLRNSIIDEDELLEDDIELPDRSGDNIKSERIDNTTTSKKEGSVRFKIGTKEPKHDSPLKHSRGVGKTKDSQVLQNMIEKVGEELCLQQADSPFFDKAVEINPPPTFTNEEVELAQILGKGEFCQIFEVSKFNVPESCHICFLHRGFNDPKMPSEGGEHSGISKVPSSVILNLADVLERNDDEEGELQLTCQPTRSESPLPKLSIFSPFQPDENISDYDELESDHEDDIYDRNNTRGFMKDHCLRNGEARYAVKRIRNDLVGEDVITDAAIDLAREGQFLAGLSHPNIIKIRGTINIPGHPKYCLILDRLYDTLEVQMLKWKEQVKRNQGKFKGLIGKKTEELNKIWMARLLAAYDLAHALSHLHKHGIIHRDIKPQNIAFDIRNDIKIFDFGLAKELKPIEREGKDEYETSGLAGTRRYMAPEVAEILPYGKPVDVFSFAVLVWEMLSLKTAFDNYSRERHYKEIIVEGKRPKISKSWPFSIKNLIQRGWAPKPSDRPTFQSICEMIKFGLPEQNFRSDRSTDSLLRRSVQSRSGHKEEFRALRMVENDESESERQSGSMSASIRAKCDSLPDSLSTSIHVKMNTSRRVTSVRSIPRALTKGAE